MKKSFALSDLILLFLICAAVTIIILFVDFSDREIRSHNIDVYRAYYLYDEKSEPISLSYEMVELNKNIKKEEAIEEVFEVIRKNYSETVRLNDVIIEDKKVIIELSEDIITPSNKAKIDALVSSILDIDDYNELEIKIQDTEIVYNYGNNISEYYINSPIQNKLSTFLYKDENYTLLYENSLNKEIKMKIADSSKTHTKYLVIDDEEQEIKWSIKRDGLYRENDRILNSTYRVGEEYSVNKNANATINYVRLQEDSTLLIEVLITDIEGNKEIIILKQGIGIYKYSKYVNDSFIEEYSFKEKVFNEG